MELTESETLKSSLIVKERKNKKLPVYNGGLGANPFPAHQKLLDLLNKYSNKKNYTSPKGIDEIQKSIKNKYSSENYQVDNIIVGNGLKELLYVLLCVRKCS